MWLRNLSWSRLCRDCVPLIDDHDDADSLIVDHTGDVGVLGRHPFGGIDHQQRYLRTAQGPRGTEHTPLFHAGTDPPAPSNPCCVNQDDLLSLPDEPRIDGVSGRPGDRADDGSFFADQPIEEG